jgi:hypothetical protein
MLAYLSRESISKWNAVNMRRGGGKWIEQAVFSFTATATCVYDEILIYDYL